MISPYRRSPKGPPLWLAVIVGGLLGMCLLLSGWWFGK